MPSYFKQSQIWRGQAHRRDIIDGKACRGTGEGMPLDRIPAVRNAIKYSYTNGIVERKNHRLKNKKRECYGRAGFELLRRKVILSNYG